MGRALLGLSAIACLACSGELEEVAQLPGGVASVAIVGRDVLFAQAGSLRVLDVTALGDGSTVLVAGVSGRIEAAGSRLVTLNATTLTVFDLADDGRVERLGSLEVEQGRWETLAVGPTVAIRGFLPLHRDRTTELSVFDLSDPRAPREVAQTRLPEGTDFADDLALSGDLLLVAARLSGLYIIDLSDPLSPQILSQTSLGRMWARGVTAQGPIAYVAESMRDGASSVHIVDISDPARPQLVESQSTPGTAQHVVVAEDRLYVADRGAGLRVYDITTQTRPVFLGRRRTGFNVDKVLAGDSVVVGWGEVSRRAVVFRRSR